jgi:hypothetical protein
VLEIVAVEIVVVVVEIVVVVVVVVAGTNYSVVEKGIVVVVETGFVAVEIVEEWRN